MNLYPTSALLVVLGLASPAAVFAQAAPTADIEAQHRQGMALRAAHNDQAARTLFEGLWTRTHEPRARARQALAEHALNLFAEAEAHLVEALSHQDDPWIRQSRTLLEPILQQSRAGQGISVLSVVCATPGAEIFVNGSSAGHPGDLVRVPPGRITFEVRSRGFATVSRSIELQPGATVHEEVTLVQATQAAANTQVTTGQTTGQTAGQTTGQTTGQTAGSGPALVIVAPPPPASSGGGLRTAAWVTGALAVAGGATAGIVFLVRTGPAAEWNGETCTATNPACLRARTRAEDLETPIIVAGVIGGVFAVTSTVLFIASALAPTPRSETTARTRISCAPGMGVGFTSLTCGGTF